MINPDPWAEWKSGQTSGESNAWTDYQKENPVQVTDLSNSGVDPFEAIAGGALATIIGKGIGAAIQAAFADGGVVRKPKTEREAIANRQRRAKIAKARGDLRLAMGGTVSAESSPSSSEDIAALAIAWKLSQAGLSPEAANDPETIRGIVEACITPEFAAEIMDEFLAFLDQQGSESILAVVNALTSTGDQAPAAYTETQAASPAINPEDGGVQLAGGGFLGGNLGIALGSGVDQWNQQRRLGMLEEEHSADMKLKKPQLDTLDEQEAALRSGYRLKSAEDQANASMIDARSANARMKLAGEGQDLHDAAVGRLSNYKDDTAGGLDYLNKAGLSQYGGGQATGLAFDSRGANVTLSDGSTVLIPQATIDRGAQSLNGKYGFMQDRYSGDIIRTNDRTGSAEVISSHGGSTNPPLSMAQENSNKQIDVSRRRIAGLTPEEIQRRTAKATDTGRPNPDFDPTLAQHVRLANKRKYGPDDWYDQQGQTNQPSGNAATDGQNQIASRFSADPSMRGRTLGKQTAKGAEVYDASGKLIGYYN